MQQQQQKSSKLLKGMALGAVAGAALTMFDSTTRTKVKKNTKGAKDTVTHFTSKVREDPSGTKDQVMERVQGASEVLKEVVIDLQKIYEKANNNLADKFTDLQEDSQAAISSTKEAGKDLKEVGSKLKEAKDELVDNSEDRDDQTMSQGQINEHARVNPPQL